jgi:cysteine desulfurase family protein (TIGR01976 family)
MNAPSPQPETAIRLDANWVRTQFPSLKLEMKGRPAAFLDAPAGTQVPQRVIDAFREYFETSNANTVGQFLTSRRTDEMIAGARAAMADLFNCTPDEVFFGPNMTTLTFALARGIGRELRPGDEIVVTTLDHDGNVAPWRALEDQGVIIRQVDIRESDCTLRMDDLRRKITPRTKLVAVGYASNAVGTINPIAEIVQIAHKAGALAFIDAVHYAPHGSIDVRALDCDFLACSPYKFFGPHMGCVYGRRELLLRFRPYKVRPAPAYLPDRWETGTQIHEGLAGVTAAVDYLADLGRHSSAEPIENRRAALLCAYRAIRQYEMALARQMIEGLLDIPGLRLYGITDPMRFADRCPTVGVRVRYLTPLDCAKFLGDRGIFTWDGNYYALNLTNRLGVEQTGGLLRIGLVHYNTAEEVDRLLNAMRELAKSA